MRQLASWVVILALLAPGTAFAEQSEPDALARARRMSSITNVLLVAGSTLLLVEMRTDNGAATAAAAGVYSAALLTAIMTIRLKRAADESRNDRIHSVVFGASPSGGGAVQYRLDW